MAAFSLRRAVAALAVLLGLLFSLVPQTAHAHAVLLSADPAMNAVIATPQQAITLRFNEPVSPLVTRLLDPDGNDILLGAPVVIGDVLSVDMPADLGSGTHALVWRVTSADGHPVGGTLFFSIGMVTGGSDANGIDPLLIAGVWLVRFAIFVTLFVGVGGVAVSGLLLPHATRPMPGPFWVAATGVVLAPVSLGLQGADAAGLSLAGLLDATAWQLALSTAYGGTALAIFMASALAMAMQMLPGGWVRQVWAFGLLALIGAALSVSGHAGTAEPQALTRAAVFIHVAALGFWIGALWPLLDHLRIPARRSDVLAGFSQWAPLAVCPLLVSGALLGAIQLGPLGPAWLAPYGLVLFGKLALVLVLLGLACWNRFVLTAPALAGNGTANRRLARMVVAELVVVVLILALAAAWRFTPPPRALALVPDTPLHVHVHTAALMADMTMTPPRAGHLDFNVHVFEGAFVPLTPLSLEAEFALPERGIDPFVVAFEDLGEGVFAAQGVPLVYSGLWEMRLSVRVSRFDLQTLRAEFELP